ncbi:hypothetical protein Pla52o_48220 [Novipirellula galeiformis]|uniref:Uncharacterized protein n=2 Tax=Novipirellula galeiformis TaxID=2528004 RepID=A0A5C6C6P5_9BACT|nr:hypothetical protein Pla52o_48220 [Novipirellula galeiformis]
MLMTAKRLPSGIGGILLVYFILGASGCGGPAPKPLNVAADSVASLDPHVPFLLPANTQLEAMSKCVVSFPGADLFEEGEVIGEVVVVDNDALIYLAPNKQVIAVTLEHGQSMSITKPRTITVDETDAAPCRFKVTRPDGT